MNEQKEKLETERCQSKRVTWVGAQQHDPRWGCHFELFGSYAPVNRFGVLLEPE